MKKTSSISVPAVPWHEDDTETLTTFHGGGRFGWSLERGDFIEEHSDPDGSSRAAWPDHPWPNESQSKELGCTCYWFGCAIVPDESCPILSQHRREEPWPR